MTVELAASRQPSLRFLLCGASLLAAVGCTDEPGIPGSNAGGTPGGAGLASGGSSAGMVSSGGIAGSVVPMGGAGGGAVSGAGGGAGASGDGGASGSGGSAGAGGGNGKPGATPSAGCTAPGAEQDLASWVEQARLDVNGDDRQWWVWLPTGYDPTRAYPVIFTFHGCGGPNNFMPIQEESGSDAIVVRGTGADDGCWTYGLEGDDVKFFDAMLAKLEATRCVDSSRIFSMGYSSGGWMTNTLECSRGDKLRATGTMSGGRAHNGQNCKGKFARATVHDLNDGTNPFDSQGADDELERVLEQNHCMTDVPPVMEDPEPCARYQGCDAGYPVIACRTSGEGHNRQDDLANPVFWKLFSSL